MSLEKRIANLEIHFALVVATLCVDGSMKSKGKAIDQLMESFFEVAEKNGSNIVPLITAIEKRQQEQDEKENKNEC